MLNRPVILIALVLVSISALAQDDSPSLGDVARQTRQQKQAGQKSNSPTTTNSASPSPSPSPDAHSDAATKNSPNPPVKHVFTNEEVSSHIVSAGAESQASRPTDSSSSNSGPSRNQAQAENWTAQIKAQKEMIASLESEIERVSSSIQYAGGNCVSGCVEWNQAQQRKQQQVDNMKSQLEQARQRLDEMQESARRQGFGSSVYDP